MSKRTRLVATYRPNADELFQVSVEVRDDYPDCLNQARAEVVRGVRDMVGDTIAAYRLAESDKADET